MRTFRGVAKNFRDVFSELVPNGKGSIIMRSRADEESKEDVNSDDDAEVWTDLKLSVCSLWCLFKGTGQRRCPRCQYVHWCGCKSEASLLERCC
jgi:hypothetical protein